MSHQFSTDEVKLRSNAVVSMLQAIYLSYKTLTSPSMLSSIPTPSSTPPSPHPHILKPSALGLLMDLSLAEETLSLSGLPKESLSFYATS